MLESEAIIAWALGAHADPRVRTTQSTRGLCSHDDPHIISPQAFSQLLLGWEHELMLDVDETCSKQREKRGRWV